MRTGWWAPPCAVRSSNARGEVRAVVRRAGSAPALRRRHRTCRRLRRRKRAPGQSPRAPTRSSRRSTRWGPPGKCSTRVGVRGHARSSLALLGTPASPGFVHVSTAGVYDRSAGVGDVAVDGALLPEGKPAPTPIPRTPPTPRSAQVGGLTTVLVRPPAILGGGDTSVWNTLRPARIRGGVTARGEPGGDLGLGARRRPGGPRSRTSPTGRRLRPPADPERGPVGRLARTPVIVAGEPATWRDYLRHGDPTALERRTGSGTDEPGVDRAACSTDRARGWGWAPRVSLAQAMDELRRGLDPEPSSTRPGCLTRSAPRCGRRRARLLVHGRWLGCARAAWETRGQIRVSGLTYGGDRPVPHRPPVRRPEWGWFPSREADWSHSITGGLVATCAALDAEALYSARSPAEYEPVRAVGQRPTSTCPPTTVAGRTHSRHSASWLGPGATRGRYR